MFNRLFNIVLSSLIFLTPINPVTGTNDFPFTRLDNVFYRVSYTVDDLGSTLDLLDGPHDYVVDYLISVYCSSACSYRSPKTSGTNSDGDSVYTGAQIDSNSFELHFTARVDQKTPSQMYSLLNGYAGSGNASESHTYNYPDSYASIDLSISLHYGTVTPRVFFAAVYTDGWLADIAYSNQDIANYTWATLIFGFLGDEDIEPTQKQLLNAILNNGNIEGAYNFVTNYYQQNGVQQSSDNETINNNFATHDTTLNTFLTTENIFATGIENQFQQQINNVSPANNITTDNNFITSANWVTQQFNRMTNNNAIGAILGFSLLIGFAMALIGRIL